MKTTVYTLVISTYLYLIPSFSVAQNEDVQVTVATGLEISSASAMSPNNKFCALSLYNAVSLWDVNTGRLLRHVAISPTISDIPDSLWFSEDNSTLICQLVNSNNVFHVNVASGESEFIKGEPMDWTNYKYVPNIRQASGTHLFSGKKKDLFYKTPNSKAKLHYKMIKNPVFSSSLMPYMYEANLVVNGKSIPVDTVTQANFTFSPDGSYVFMENSILELETGRIISKLKILPYSGQSVMFLPGTRIPVTAGVHSLRIWDFPDIEDINIKHLSQFKPSWDGKSMICEQYNERTSQRTIFKFDMVKKKRVGKVYKTEETGYLIDVSKSGNRASFVEVKKPDPSKWDVEYNVKVVDFETGNAVNIKGTTKALFTLDEDIVLIDSIGTKNRLYNIKTKESKKLITTEQSYSDIAYYSARGGKYITTSSAVSFDEEMRATESEVYIWDMNTGETVFKNRLKGVSFTGFDVSKDEKLMAIGSYYEYAIHVYDFQSGNLIHSLKGHTSPIDKLFISDDNKRLMSSAYDGTRRLWNLETGEEMASLINTGKNDYAIITPEQYYFATKGAKKLIHFVKGDKIYPFNQFDLKYNRPDIIIQSLEASNQSLVKPFYYAYKKRLKRSGFTEEMLGGTFHMPVAQITNVDKIPLTTDQGNLTLQVKGEDSEYNLDRVIVRVNEVPISGKGGISVKDKNAQSYKDEIDVELSYGKNLIEVSVMNEKGVESIASNITIDYTPSEFTKPNLYLYTIGVSSYAQSEYNLTYAAKDAEDIQSLYGNTNVPFGKIITKQLTNEMVTIESVKAIKDDLKATNVDDAVCVFFAGHGILDVELNYYLASHDIDFKQPQDRGIPYEAFENILDDIPARKKLIMIDACHSGEIDKDEVALVENESTDSNDGDITFRAVNSTTLQTVGLNNSFEFMKELFNDVRKSSGTVIISSAGGMEYAMEGGEWKNGVFTYCFLSGIKEGKADLNEDGKIYLSEMNTYIREAVYTLTNGKQKPTNRAEVLETDWRLW